MVIARRTGWMAQAIGFSAAMHGRGTHLAVRPSVRLPDAVAVAVPRLSLVMSCDDGGHAHGDGAGGDSGSEALCVRVCLACLVIRHTAAWRVG